MIKKKRVIIGDPHGRYGILESIVNREAPADIVVLGDYLDSFDIYPEDCLEGLKRTLQLKETYENSGLGKMILLLGNHDTHYLENWPDRCSGWKFGIALEASKVLGSAISSLKMQFSLIDRVNHEIYTHAGVSKTWYDFFLGESGIEALEELPWEAFSFRGGDIYGDDPRNGPLWIRPNSLSTDPWINPEDGKVWTQVVGHTQSASPLRIDLSGDGTAWLYVIDCITSYYLQETIGDDGKITKRELIQSNYEVS